MKLTKTQLQDYVLAEASRIYTLSLVEKQKESILKEEAELQEVLTMEIMSDPIKLKEYRERLQLRAKGWKPAEQTAVI